MQRDLANASNSLADEEVARLDSATVRLLSAVSRPARFIALIGPQPAATIIVDSIMALLDSSVVFVRVANPLVSPLTVNRVILQIGGDPADSYEEEVASVVCALIRDGEKPQTVFVIEQAETMDREGLQLLRRLPDLMPPGAAPLQILFVTGHRFWDLLDYDDSNEFGELLAEGAVIEVTPPEKTDEITASVPEARSRRLMRGQVLFGTILASGVLGAAVGVLSYQNKTKYSTVLSLPGDMLSTGAMPKAVRDARATQSAVHGLLPEPASGAALAPTNNTAVAPTHLSATENSPGSEGVSAPPDADNESGGDRLRGEFNRFLSQFRPDLVTLTQSQRDLLFERYLSRRRQQQ
jgi:hypothetical protein